MSEYDDFDLDRATAQAWQGFADRLAEVLSMMDGTEPLIVDTLTPPDERGPSVTFSCQDAQLLAAVSGDSRVSPEYRLTPGRVDALLALGWQGPAAPGGDFTVSGPQEDTAPLAELTVATLRDVLGVQHPAFLAPNVLGEVLQPSPDAGPLDDTATGEDWALLSSRVADELTAYLGHTPVRDEEGDFAVRVGSTMVFVRVPSDAMDVLLFSVLVHDVAGRSRATEVINDLNSESRLVRFSLIRDRVFAAMAVQARPLVSSHLRRAMDELSAVSDGLDQVLADKLRGRTTFSAQG